MMQKLFEYLFSLPATQRKIAGKVLFVFGSLQFLVILTAADYWRIGLRFKQSEAFGLSWWMVFVIVGISAILLFACWFIGYFLIHSEK